MKNETLKTKSRKVAVFLKKLIDGAPLKLTAPRSRIRKKTN